MNDTCAGCDHFSEGDGLWPDECELTDREVLSDTRPCWCPLDDDE